jgi:hypothetical protein
MFLENLGCDNLILFSSLHNLDLLLHNGHSIPSGAKSFETAPDDATCTNSITRSTTSLSSTMGEHGYCREH